MSRVQLEGLIKIGPVGGTLVDVSDDVSKLVITTTATAVAKPATYGSPNNESRKGAVTDQVTLVYHSDESPSTGLWAVIYDAIRNGDGELEFSAVYKTGSVSPTNPKFTGIFLVTDVDTGTAVNEWKMQSKTYPARNIAGPLAS